MSKQIHCSKCGKLDETYNRFSFTFAQKSYKFNGTNNVDRFCLCHKCTDYLSSWLKASKTHSEYKYE